MKVYKTVKATELPQRIKDLIIAIAFGSFYATIEDHTYTLQLTDLCAHYFTGEDAEFAAELKHWMKDNGVDAITLPF